MNLTQDPSLNLQQRPFQDTSLLNSNVLVPNGSHIHSITESPVIRDVWEDNFQEEIKTIMQLAEKYKIIAMDTEFPGIVYRINENEVGSLVSYHEIEYRTIKMNVDKLKVIQVGISFADEDGYTPPGIGTWQFNFRFNLKSDPFLKESIEMLSEAGIRFDLHASKGIDPQVFSEYLITSGLILNEDIKWVSFHGGFDFAYLVRMLCGTDLPEDDNSFSQLLNIYFPCFYDIKYMTKDIETLKSGSLNKMANDLRVRRIGPQHQAGSDALLTLSTYLKLKTTHFKGVSEQKHANILYGIGPHGTEGINDYVLQNFIVSEYPYLMYNNYTVNTMNPMNSMNPMMNSNYYSQNDGMYPSSQYNMPYGYNAFGPNSPYMDPNSQKPKKFGNKL